MNTYTRNLKTKSRGTVRCETTCEKTGFAWFAVRISIICLMIFCAVVCRIHFTAKTERLNKHAMKVRSQIKEVNTQIYNMRNRREELTAWPYISSKIQQYHLELRAADYRQVSQLILREAPRPGSKALRTSYAVSSGRKNNAAMQEYAFLQKNKTLKK